MTIGDPAVVRKGAAYDDLLAAPDDKIAQLIGGALHLHPRPSPRHALAAARLTGELDGPFQMGRGGPGGWWILFEPEVHIGDDVVVPDIAGWRRERLQKITDAAFIDLAPDFACEILSPATRRFDLGEKRDRYLSAGVGYLWIVDPDARTLEAFAATERGWLLLATLSGEAEASLPPFEAVAFPLAALWPAES